MIIMKFSRNCLHLAGIMVLFLGQRPINAQEKDNPLDGFYTRPHSHINQKGEELEVGFFQKEVLELHNGQFRYWEISDFDTGIKYPYTGAYSKQGNIISLHHEKWQKKPKRYVTMTINGILWLWTEEGLGIWKTDKDAVHPAVLVRVGKSPVRIVINDFGDVGPDFKGVTFPSIKPLFDMKALKAESSKNAGRKSKTVGADKIYQVLEVQRLKISAKEVKENKVNGTTTYLGKVDFSHPELQLKCDQLVIYMNEVGVEGKSPVRQVVATGEMVIVERVNAKKKKDIGHARKVTYHSQSGDIVLSGGPPVLQTERQMVRTVTQDATITLMRGGTYELIDRSRCPIPVRRVEREPIISLNRVLWDIGSRKAEDGGGKRGK